MNRSQWLVFGVGSLLVSGFMFKMASATICHVGGESVDLGFCLARYLYAITAMIFHFLGWIFIICCFLEFKK